MHSSHSSGCSLDASRELLMLKDYVENTLGKKLSLKVISDIEILKGEHFKNKYLKNGN